MELGLNTSSLDTAIRDAQVAERLGFDYLGCGEHLFFHGPMPNSFIQLAAAAGATTSIRLVSAITLLPLYPAALAGKLAASLDIVSGGRFELGVGAGGEYPAEFHAVGVDPATRFRRMDEGLEILHRLFSGETVDFDGEFASLHDVTLDPAPLTPGGPRIWMGGRKPGAIRRAGRYADVFMPYMVEPSGLRRSLDAVDVAAVEAGREPGDVSGAAYLWTCVDPDGDWARKTGVDTVSRTYAQDFAPLADRYLALGTPEQVVDRVRQYADAGAGRVLFQIAAPPEHRDRVVATLARDVVPQLRAGARPDPADPVRADR
ncbi:LLM class flavin-dependent oxidoreductase [Modestobacter versicolor]|uniref:LLM class flavin-dependent oxidoreductase n=1 Tax=Modestobacter versicolor TaxID=429133 RepID=UPI0034DE8346